MKKCCKCGKEVESGYIICEDCLKPEKTADQMFKELGYEKAKEEKETAENGAYAVYIKLSQSSFTKYEIKICRGAMGKECMPDGGINYFMSFTPAEIKAVAKKIKELGW